MSGLHKSFGNLKAVDDLSFEVQEGQVFGFLGQNGSGKSTTIRMLLTLIHPTSGRIELFDKPLNEYRQEILEEVGAIIEKPDLYPYLTAREHLHYFSKFRRKHIGRNAITQTLEKVGLADRAEDKVKTYSLGMKQRLGIAIAILHDPRLVILDEPTNGLDPNGIADIRAIIRRLATEEKKTIFISSHLLAEIEQVATEILIIHKGRKMVQGKTSQLLDPEQCIVRIKTRDEQGAVQKLQAGPYQHQLLDRPDGLCLQMPARQIPAFNEYLVQQGIPVLGIDSKNNLEDYFFQMTSANSNP